MRSPVWLCEQWSYQDFAPRGSTACVFMKWGRNRRNFYRNIINWRRANLNDCKSVAGTEKCVMFTSSLPLPAVELYVDKNCRVGVTTFELFMLTLTHIRKAVVTSTPRLRHYDFATTLLRVSHECRATLVRLNGSEYQGLFQGKFWTGLHRRRHLRGSGGRAPSGVQGQSPWSGGGAGRPPEADSILAFER